MKLTGAQALIKSLEMEGTEVMFGLPGGAILPVYDPLIDSSIRHILVRHVRRFERQRTTPAPRTQPRGHADRDEQPERRRSVAADVGELRARDLVRAEEA